MSKKPHYAWAICISGLILIFVSMGVTNNGLSIFLPFLREINGFSNTQTSMLINIRSLVTFVAMIFVTQYYKKFSLRLGIFISCLLVASGFFIYSLAGANYIVYCIAAAITGVSYGVGAMIPMSILMKTWFKTNSNTAVGICTAGSGLASVILPTVLTRLIQSLGLQKAFLCEATGVVVLALVLLMIVRDKPEDKGLLPYGAKPGDHSTSMVSEDDSQENTGELYERKLPRNLWIYLTVGALVMGIMANPAFVHLSVLFTTEGYSANMMAYLITAIGIILMVSKILFGRIADKLGGKKTCTIFNIILIIGMSMCALCFTGNKLILVLAIAFSGVGLSISTVAPSVWSSDIALTKEQYPVVLKRIQLLFALGALVFQSVPGILADIFGTYTISYGIFGVMVLINLITILKVYKIRKNL